jgi:hypothetical protein
VNLDAFKADPAKYAYGGFCVERHP